MTRRTLSIGNHRFLVGPWHDGADVAYLSVAPSSRSLPTPGAVTECLHRLADDGYSGAVTAALRPPESAAFSSAGFEVKERLQVLRHDLSGDLGSDSSPRGGPPAIATRRARRSDRPAVLEVDQMAFEPFWRLGRDGLQEALDATASVRFRVLDNKLHLDDALILDNSVRGDSANTPVVGYAICGRTLDVGYLQRLAVHPAHLRRGLGSALVRDGMRWLKRRRGRMMLVNTQESNHEALALYLRLGFSLDQDRLTVLSWTADS